MPTDDTIYAFGSFALNVSARSLSIDGKPVALGSRSFEILVALVQRRGEVVSKEDLLARAWPNIHVEEHNLKVHVSALRRAFGKRWPRACDQHSRPRLQLCRRVGAEPSGSRGGR